MKKEWENIIQELHEDNFSLDNIILRKAVLEIYKYKCPYTNKKISLDNLHLDHFIPKKQLPNNKKLSLDNIVPSIESFNLEKNSLSDNFNESPSFLTIWMLNNIKIKAIKIRKIISTIDVKKRKRKYIKENNTIDKHNSFLERYKNNIVYIEEFYNESSIDYLLYFRAKDNIELKNIIENLNLILKEDIIINKEYRSFHHYEKSKKDDITYIKIMASFDKWKTSIEENLYSRLLIIKEKIEEQRKEVYKEEKNFGFDIEFEDIVNRYIIDNKEINIDCFSFLNRLRGIEELITLNGNKYIFENLITCSILEKENISLIDYRYSEINNMNWKHIYKKLKLFQNKVSIYDIFNNIKEGDKLRKKIRFSKKNNFNFWEVNFYSNPKKLENNLNKVSDIIKNIDFNDIQKIYLISIIYFYINYLNINNDNKFILNIISYKYLNSYNWLLTPIIPKSINKNNSNLLQENIKEYILLFIENLKNNIIIQKEKLLKSEKIFKEKQKIILNELTIKNKEIIIDLLFKNVYVSFWEILDNLELSKPTLIKKLGELEKKWIIQKTKKWKNTLYYFEEYVKILKN